MKTKGEIYRKVDTPKEALLNVVDYTPEVTRSMARHEYQNPPLKHTGGANARWYIRVRLRDNDGDRSQGRIYLGFLKDVKAKEAERQRALKLAEVNKKAITITSSDVLLKTYVPVYLEQHLPTVGVAAQRNYKRYLVNHILPAFGNFKLSEITTKLIQKFLNEKQNRCDICERCKGHNGEGCNGLSWSTRTTIRNIFSGLFTKAVDFGYWGENMKNPVERVSCGRKRLKYEKRILTDEQLNALLEALPAKISLLVRIADTTGMRISELLGLKWRNVDLETGWVFVKGRYSRGDYDIPKTDSSVRGLAIGDIVDELRSHHQNVKGAPDDFVFEHPNGGPYDDRNLNQHFLRKAAKKLGFYFPGFGFHTLRRGQITGNQEYGASTIEASKMAGHSRPSITAEYTVLQRQRQEQLVKNRQARLKPELVKPVRKPYTRKIA